MYIAKIAYVYTEHLNALKDVLNQFDCDVIEKTENQTKPEVWVEYSDALVELLLEDFLSSKDKHELSGFNQSAHVDWLLFYG